MFSLSSTEQRIESLDQKFLTASGKAHRIRSLISLIIRFVIALDDKEELQKVAKLRAYQTQ